MVASNSTLRWHRGLLTAFVDRHHAAWDIVSAVLTVIYVALAFRQDTASQPESVALWALAALFLAEFGARWFDSPERARYAKSHWLDLVTAVPVPGIPGLRVLRLVRMLRFLKVGILVRRWLLSRGWTDSGLIGPSLFLFWVGSAVALWLVEHDATGASIRTFGDALLAALVTASTLGFAKHALQPVTESGQIISAIMVFGALGLWGIASSQLTQLWLRGRNNAQELQLQDVHSELLTLQQQLDELAELLREALPASRMGAADVATGPSTGTLMFGPELAVPARESTASASPASDPP